MKRLIKKILKEDTEHFLWVKEIGLDPNDVESDVREYWDRCINRLDVDLDFVYDTLVKSNLRDLDLIKDIGKDLYNQFNGVKESSFESALDNCSCDGCCDDYIYYEDCEEDVDGRRTEGYEDGKESRDNEIIELKSKILDLKDRIEELRDQLNQKSS